MAIQTKKISELGSITDVTDADNIFFLGTRGGVAGKISLTTLQSALQPEDNSSAVAALENDVISLRDVISELASAPAPVANSCNCEAKIQELEAKCNAFEQFLKNLQKDGYLTLAEIKKAAAAACPID